MLILKLRKMKKLLLTAVAVFAFGFANAQDTQFKIGANVGLPLGDFKDSYSLAAGLDVAYLWEVSDAFKVGATTGFGTFSGKTTDYSVGGYSFSVKVPSFNYIPVAATADFAVSDNLFLGADLGYAINASSDGGEGGFLYQPKFGYNAEKFQVYLGYKGISNNGTLSSLNLGFAYKL